MKLSILLISVLLLGATCPQTFAVTIPKKYIRYSEPIKAGVSSFNNQGLPLKADRLSNKEGNIVLIYDESLSDSIKTSFLAAKKLWESQIQTTQPIYISVLFESLGEDIAMAAEVPYCEGFDLEGCPTALASQIMNESIGTIEVPDGIIILNSDIAWNCRFSKDATSEYNIPTMVLRGIARCLGFGSTITEDNRDKFSYFFGYPTYFDKLLYSNNKAMTDIQEESPAMADFVKSNNVYAKTQTQNHKIFAPRNFVQNLSLCYFDDNASLMSYTLGQGDVDLSVDEKTADVLRTIGWDIPSTGLSIQCDDISDDGIGSSYKSHTFSLKKGNENVSDYSWRFLLKNRQGNYTQVSGGTAGIFTISEISSPENFLVNINGDLEGRIECDYSINGKRYNAVPFTLSLELKPIILSIDDISVINNGLYLFYLDFNVRYTGADHISVEIEEEYNTSLRTYRFDEPYIAHIRTGNITNLYYSWVTVIANNKYGTAYETIEYAPAYRTNKSVENYSVDKPDVSSDYPVANKIILYNIDGGIIFQGTPLEFHNQVFNSGVYLKKEIFDNGISKISKILF